MKLVRWLTRIGALGRRSCLGVVRSAATRRRLLKACILMGAGAGVSVQGWARDWDRDAPTTPPEYYALGEQVGQCAAYFSMLAGLDAAGRADPGIVAARDNLRRASKVALTMGGSKNIDAEARGIESFRLQNLQKRLLDGGSTKATLDMLGAESLPVCKSVRGWVAAVAGAALASSAPAQPDPASTTPLLDAAISKYHERAMAGDPHAQYMIGSALARTEGRDYLQQAERWLLLSAEQGFRSAAYSLGSLYLRRSPQRNPAKAVHWLTKGAEAGDSAAQWLLGTTYQDGDGVPVDYRKALHWYTKSADQGDKDAQSALGGMYLEGQGVPRQYDRAVMWLSKAATQGESGALRLLGQCYERGHGVAKSLAAAHILYNLATANGEKSASEGLARVEERLSAEQVVVAQRLAAAWAPGKRLPLPSDSASEPPKRPDRKPKLVT
jgi:hypothetical protein